MIQLAEKGSRKCQVNYRKVPQALKLSQAKSDGDLQRRCRGSCRRIPELYARSSLPKSREQTPPSHHHHPPPRPPTSSRAWAGAVNRLPNLAFALPPSLLPSTAHFRRAARTGLSPARPLVLHQPLHPRYNPPRGCRASTLKQSPWRVCTPMSTSRCPGHTGITTASTSAGVCWRTTRSCAKSVYDPELNILLGNGI